MRTSEAALALFLVPSPPDGDRYLAQWNPRWAAFHFPGGHREPGESFRACVGREVREELDLTEGRDFRIVEPSLRRLEFVAFSEGAGVETAYLLVVYRAELTPEASGRVEANPDNRWLSRDEILAGVTADGRRVSPTMKRILTMLDLA